MTHNTLSQLIRLQVSILRGGQPALNYGGFGSFPRLLAHVYS
jgi:hypothetical protein